MEIEFPNDLIKQVQISIHKEAKIPLKEQASPLKETTDRVPDHLKCAHCKTRLLHSLICIFCGKQQQHVLSRQPINFRNTIGYKWLLTALDCDGSEVVGSPVDENESSVGQSSRKDEKTLSDLLDLEIKWPSENERIEGVLSSDGESVLNRVGVYLDDDDDFFPDVRADSVSKVIEIKKPVDPVYSGVSQVQGSRSLFENVQPSETVVKDSEEKTIDSSFSGWEASFQLAGKEDAGSMSKEQVDSGKDISATETSDLQNDKNMSLFENVEHSQSAAEGSMENKTADDFSGWDAEFQTADSGALNESNKSPDPFPSSEVDLSAHMDTVFGSVEKINNVEAKEETITLPSTTDTWFQDDMWGNFNSSIGVQGANSEMTANVKVLGGDAEDEKISSFDNIDWGKNDQWQSISVKDSKHKAMDDNDDSFDAWSDFTSSANVDPSFSFRDQNASHSQSSPEQSSGIDFFGTDNNSQASNIGFPEIDFFSDLSINKSSSPKEENVVETEGSVKDREIANTQGKAEATVKDIGLSHTDSTPRAYDAESLISQMHDLSFMLENHISIPKS